MKRYLLYIVITAIGAIPFLKPEQQPLQNHLANAAVLHEAKPQEQVELAKPEQSQPAPAPQPIAPVQAVQPTITTPAKWAVSSTPNTRVPVSTINRAVQHLQNMGLSKQGTAYLVGNYLGESSLIPCGNWGDGGRAHGFGQWHPGRRQDMPCGFEEQLTWSVNVEMVRDTPQLRNVLFDSNSDVETIKHWIYRWERWGVLGSRWVYAAAIHQQLNAIN